MTRRQTRHVARAPAGVLTIDRAFDLARAVWGDHLVAVMLREDGGADVQTRGYRFDDLTERAYMAGVIVAHLPANVHRLNADGVPTCHPSCTRHRVNPRGRTGSIRAVPVLTTIEWR